MKFGFLGHNGFGLGSQSAPVLLDAILFPQYGQEYTSSPVEIYPPRLIDVERMPTPAAVLVSHEHSDHFHLPSLDLLPRHVPVLVGPTMIQPVVDCIERLGFTVLRLPFGETHMFGDVSITLYPPGRGTVLWESRVSQVYIRDASTPEIGGFFLGIDALISDMFIEHVEVGKAPAPAVIGVSNNAQVTPDGVFGSLGNLKGYKTSRALGRSPFVGLGILLELLDGTLARSHALRDSHFLVCGGGFLKDYEQMGPFPFSEQKDMASAAQALVRQMSVIGPEPGDVVDVIDGRPRVTGTLDWLSTDRDRLSELTDKRAQFLQSGQTIPMKRLVDAADQHTEDAAISLIAANLDYYAKAVLLARLGQVLLETAHTTGNPTPLVFKLLCSKRKDLSLALDLRAGRFTEVDDDLLEGTIDRYPFGVVVYATDLAAVLRGDLQVWDVVGVAMWSWYVGEPLNSPVAVMYDAYGEQVRPDLTDGSESQKLCRQSVVCQSQHRVKWDRRDRVAVRNFRSADRAGLLGWCGRLGRTRTDHNLGG